MASSGEKEEVRRRADIVDVVGAYVTLKRAGNVYKGLCPFHNEKTPSFQVNPDKGLWHCFGQCSEGGDVFKFVQKIENLTFPEALERLAKKTGVILSEFRPSGGPPPEPGHKERLYNAVEFATQFYEEMLTRGQAARDYLDRRGLGYDVQRAFRIGYAGDDSDALMHFLGRKGVSTDDAVEAGLVVANERGFRDKLWQRVVFPIVNVEERPIAFGGRLMESIEGRPKYLNSAETPLFSKGRTLYGLWRARKAIAATGQAMIVEGYMDVVACHQAGYENVIATLGTALTENHATLIKRYAQRVLLAFDADAAGMKAARNADEIFARIGMETRMLEMPSGEDPDSVLRDGHRDILDRAITSALRVTEFQLRKLVQRADRENASEDERLDLFRREALATIRATESVTERQRYIGIVAPLHPFYFSVNARAAEEQIQQEIEGRIPQLPYQYRPNRNGERWGENREYSKRESTRSDKPGWRNYPPRQAPSMSAPLAPPPRAIDTAERMLIRGLLDGGEEIVGIITSELVKEDLLNDGYWPLLERVRSGQDPASAMRDLEDEDPEIYSALVRLAVQGSEPMATLKGETVPLDALLIRGCIAELRARRLNQTERQLRDRANEGDLEAQRELTEFVRRRKGSGAA